MILSFFLFYASLCANKTKSDDIHRICVSGIDEEANCFLFSPSSIFVTKDNLNEYLIGLSKEMIKNIEISVVDSPISSPGKIEFDFSYGNLSFISLLKIRNADTSNGNFQFIKIKQLMPKMPFQKFYLEGINILYNKESKQNNVVEFKSLILMQSSFLAFSQLSPAKYEIQKDYLTIIAVDLFADSYSISKSSYSIATATVSGNYIKLLGLPKYQNSFKESKNLKISKSLEYRRNVDKINIITNDATNKSMIQKARIASFLNNYLFPQTEISKKLLESNHKMNIKADEVVYYVNTTFIKYNNNQSYGESVNVSSNQIKIICDGGTISFDKQLTFNILGNSSTSITFEGFGEFYTQNRPSITNVTILHQSCPVILSSTSPDDPVPYVTVSPSSDVTYRPKRPRQLKYCVCLQSRFVRCKQSLECENDGVDPANYVTGKEESFLDTIADYRTSSVIRLIITHTGTETLNIDFKSFVVPKEIIFVSASSDITTQVCLREDKLGIDNVHFAVVFNRITNVNLDEVFNDVSLVVLQNTNLIMNEDNTVETIFTDSYSIQNFENVLTVTKAIAINSSSPLQLSPNRIVLDKNCLLLIPSVTGFPHIFVGDDSIHNSSPTPPSSFSPTPSPPPSISDIPDQDSSDVEISNEENTITEATDVNDGISNSEDVISSITESNGNDEISSTDSSFVDDISPDTSSAENNNEDSGLHILNYNIDKAILTEDTPNADTEPTRCIKFSDEDDIYTMTFMLKDYNQSIYVGKVSESDVNITISSDAYVNSTATRDLDKTTNFYFIAAPYGMQVDFTSNIPIWMQFHFQSGSDEENTNQNQVVPANQFGVSLNLTIDDPDYLINFGNLSGNFDLILMTSNTLSHFFKFSIQEDSNLRYYTSNLATLTLDFQEYLTKVTINNGNVQFVIGNTSNNLTLPNSIANRFRVTTLSPIVTLGLTIGHNPINDNFDLYFLNNHTTVKFDDSFSDQLDQYENMQRLNFVHLSNDITFVTDAEYVPFVNITEPISGVLYSKSNASECRNIQIDSLLKAHGIAFTRTGPCINVIVNPKIGYVVQEALLSQKVIFEGNPFKFAISTKSRAHYIFQTFVAFVPRSRYPSNEKVISDYLKPKNSATLLEDALTENNKISLEAESLSFDSNSGINQTDDNGKLPLSINTGDLKVAQISSIDSSNFGPEGIKVSKSASFTDNTVNKVNLGSNSVTLTNSNGVKTPSVTSVDNAAALNINTNEKEVSISCDSGSVPNNVNIQTGSDTQKVTFDNSWNRVTNAQNVVLDIMNPNTELNTEMLSLPNILIKRNRVPVTDKSSLNIIENEPSLTGRLGFFIFIGIFAFVLVLALGFAIIGCCSLDKKKKKKSKDGEIEDEEDDEKAKEDKNKKDKKTQEKAAKKEGDAKAKEDKKAAKDAAKEEKKKAADAKKAEKEAAKEAKKGEKADKKAEKADKKAEKADKKAEKAEKAEKKKK